MAAGKDFPPPSEGHGFIDWCTTLFSSNKAKAKTKSQELFSKSVITHERTQRTENKITKGSGFFQTLDFLHIFTRPESYVIEVKMVDLPLQAEKRALSWLHEQYAACIQDEKNALFFEPWQRTLYKDPEFQTLAKQFSEHIERAEGDEVIIRQLSLSTLQSAIELAKKYHNKPFASDDLQPLAMLLLLKADNPKLLTRDFLGHLQTITGEKRAKVLSDWRYSITQDNITEAICALRACGLSKIADELGSYVQAYDADKIEQLFSEESDVCSGNIGYSLTQLTGAIKLFSGYAATFQQSSAFQLRQKSTLSKFVEKIDFMHLFHERGLPSSVGKIYVNKGVKVEYTLSREAQAIVKTPHFAMMATRLRSVSVETYEDRFFIIKYLADELASILSVEKCQDLALKKELLNLLLLQAKNPHLLSATLEKHLREDLERVPDADSDLKQDYQALIECIHKQRELLTVQSAVQRVQNYAQRQLPLPGANVQNCADKLNELLQKPDMLRATFADQLIAIHAEFLDGKKMSLPKRRGAFRVLVSRVQNPHLFSDAFLTKMSNVNDCLAKENPTEEERQKLVKFQQAREDFANAIYYFRTQ